MVEPKFEKEKESSVGMALQLLIQDLFAEVVVAVWHVADEEGEHEVVAEKDDARQKLSEALLAFVDLPDFADARVLTI